MSRMREKDIAMEKIKKPRFHLTQGEAYVSHFQGMEIRIRFEQNRGAATKFRIIAMDGSENQKVFIPTSQTHNLDSLDWFWSKWDSRHKLELSGYAVYPTTQLR